MKTIALLLSICFLFSCATVTGKREEEQGPAPVAEEYYGNAVAMIDRGDIAGGLNQLIQARTADPESEKIRNKYEETVSRLEISIRYDRTTVKRGRPIPGPLTCRITYRTEEKKNPVTGMEVRFRFIRGHGILTDRATTDDMGIARCYVERVDGFEDSVVIEAVPLLDTGKKTILILNMSRRFAFTEISILDSPHRVFVSDIGSRNGGLDVLKLCTGLKRVLEENGFTDVKCTYEKDAELTGRALALEEDAVVALRQSGSETLILVTVKTSFISQQEVDFFVSGADIQVRFVDPAGAAGYGNEISARGAGPTRDRSSLQAVDNALDLMINDIDSYLKELRREYGI